MCISKKLTHYSNDLYSKTPGRMDNSTKPYHDLTSMHVCLYASLYACLPVACLPTDMHIYIRVCLPISHLLLCRRFLEVMVRYPNSSHTGKFVGVVKTLKIVGDTEDYAASKTVSISNSTLDDIVSTPLVLQTKPSSFRANSHKIRIKIEVQIFLPRA